MANDNYQRQMGRRFAVELIQTLRNLANDPAFVMPVIDRLEQSCANKPPSFSAGVLEITRDVRRCKSQKCAKMRQQKYSREVKRDDQRSALSVPRPNGQTDQ